ncbi:MAG: epoxyqueuosine reductase QueH [Candidatus Omnitrophica bacterium]|nr:epoxyqueuosine reductase QueH [Candidatus Omnitrophota bacterium]
MIQAPGNEKKILLHSCCAPCSCSIIQRIVDGGIEPTVFFYNPNIYPKGEYELRKKEVLRYIQKVKVPFVDADYEIDGWLEATQGHEADLERGKRCTICFEMRLGKTAAYAAQTGFKVFATSLGISRWKDLEQVNRAGEKAAALFPGLVYWAQNWRLGDGQKQMEQISREENFYRQNYCGCLYSLRESQRRKLGKSLKDQPAR